MRALLQHGYGTPDVFSVGAVPDPTPGRGEVLVKVHAAGVDRGTWHVMTGRPFPVRPAIGLLRPRQRVPGLDLSGTVVGVGPGVTRFRAGDRVFGIGRGSLAELACAPEEKLARAPASLPLEEAAVLGVSGLTALQALGDAGRVRAGERVLVLGASGGVGTFAVQLAVALGAQVTAVCSAAKAALVRSLGAARVLDYRSDDPVGGPERYDVVLDVAGGLPVARLRAAMTAEGRLVFVGDETGGDWFGFLVRPLAAMLRAPLGRQRFTFLVSRERFEGLERLARLVDEGRLRPVIDRRVPLEGVAQALRDLGDGKVRGKVLVTPA
jgi:NADPH:quinone reductase-like Zn-dependent oxidoreductase